MIFYIVFGSLGLLSGILGTIYLVLHMISPTNNGISFEGIREFTFNELSVATNAFRDNVGKGAFGVVYRGRLNDGSEIAVKRANTDRLSLLSQSLQKSFDSEVRMLSRIDDTNIVKLLGVCHQRYERILVYSYLQNGSLSDHLQGKRGDGLNSWRIRNQVALGVAKGIRCLHHLVPPIIHRDMKAGNILLDQNFDAVICDFGLALMDPVSPVDAPRIAGTYGYMDPQCAKDGVPTIKNDVYAFGVVLLQIITGKGAVERGVNLVEYVKHELQHNHNEYIRILDRRVPFPNENERKVVVSMLEIALACVSCDNDGKTRPQMDTIVATLESDFQTLCDNDIV